MNGDGNGLRLPRLYFRKELLVDKEEIATPVKNITMNAEAATGRCSSK